MLYQIDDTLPVDLELGESIQSTSTSASNSLLESVKQDDSLNARDTALFQETSDTGSLDFSVYASYWKAIGHILSLIILCSVIFMQISRNMTDWWLAGWVTNQESNSSIPNATNLSVNLDHVFVMTGWSSSEDSDISFYLKIYVGFAVMNNLFTLLRAFVFAYGGVRAATKIHKLLLKSVIKVGVGVVRYLHTMNKLILYIDFNQTLLF